MRNAFENLATETSAASAVTHLARLSSAVFEDSLVVGPRTQAGSGELNSEIMEFPIDTTGWRRLVFKFDRNAMWMGDRMYIEIQQTPGGSWAGAPVPSGAWDGTVDPMYTETVAVDTAGVYAARLRVDMIWEPYVFTYTLSSQIAPDPIAIEGTVSVQGELSVFGKVRVDQTNATGFRFVSTSAAPAAQYLSNSSNVVMINELTVSNPTTSPAYLKMYGPSYPTVKTVTMGTTAPIAVFTIPAGETVVHTFGPAGKYVNGASIAVTGGIAALDRTAPPAGILVSATLHQNW